MQNNDFQLIFWLYMYNPQKLQFISPVGGMVYL